MRFFESFLFLFFLVSGEELEPNYNAYEKIIVFRELNITTKFEIKFTEAHDWKKLCGQFEQKYGVKNSQLCDAVEKHLLHYKFPHDILQHSKESESNPRISSYHFVNEILHSGFNESYPSEDLQPILTDHMENLLIYPKIKKLFTHTNPHVDLQFLRLENYLKSSSSSSSPPSSLSLSSIPNLSSYIPSFLRDSQVILIYQSLGTTTGGTIALELLYQRIKLLGFQTILCDSQSNNEICHSPTGHEIVITGEWCHGVLESHGINPYFRGRGVQYHLGFHHYDDICSGHITLTHTHYLASSLSHRILGGYFLGCEMTFFIRETFLDLLALEDSTDLPNLPSQKVLLHERSQSLASIQKEDLVIIDTDLIRDYPFEEINLNLQIPSGYQIMEAKDIPREAMPALLLRAKIVIDLALPGQERISGEGILMGAIPVISKLWNGVSEIDQQSIHKVCGVEGNETEEEDLLILRCCCPHLLQVNPYNSTEISETIAHIARNYETEIKNYKNSQFFNYMLTAGYIRNDIFDPNTHKINSTSLQLDHSYLRIRHFSHLLQLSKTSTLPLTPLSADLLPSWGTGLLCVLPSGILPHNPLILLKEIKNHLNEKEILSIPVYKSESFSTSDVTFPHILLIPPQSSLTHDILSQLISTTTTTATTMIERSEHFLSFSFLHICSLFSSINTSQKAQRSFLEGVTLSTPWQSLRSHTEEMGMLPMLRCDKQ